MTIEQIPEETLTPALSTAATAAKRPLAPDSTRRIVSLDVFRGITIAAMILVNNPGSWESAFPPLRHAEWHGWTLADLVFPSFLFILGVAVVFSTAKRAQQGRRRLFRHVLWRSLALIALGLLLNGLFYRKWEAVRLLGVMQRIGIVYFCAAMLTVTVSRRVRVGVTVLLLVSYWGLLAMLAAPGHLGGDLSPEGNIASYIDRTLLSGHMWQENWDPEGLLSTFPALSTALLGTLVGDWLRSGRKRSQIWGGLMLAGVAAIVVGELWSLVFPINKNLWTSSYAVLTAGIACVALGACYWALEVRQWRRWGHPFKLVGMNPLAIYVASEAVAMSALDNIRSWTYANVLVPAMGEAVGSLGWALVYVAVWGVVAWAMYKKAVFLKL